MTIDRVGHVDPIPPGKKAGRSADVRGDAKSDSINLSSEAMEKSELYRVSELVAAAPDVRSDRIAELKEKINDPQYLNERIIDATADKILQSFGF
jgi:negative regulator of flagellin synthesis FlgM